MWAAWSEWPTTAALARRRRCFDTGLGLAGVGAPGTLQCAGGDLGYVRNAPWSQVLRAGAVFLFPGLVALPTVQLLGGFPVPLAVDKTDQLKG